MAKKTSKKREVRPDLQAEPGTTFSFVLDGNVPSKKNRVRFGAHGTYHDKKFTDWHKRAVIQIMDDRDYKVLDGHWIPHAKEMTISFALETLRAKDLTNMAESIMDLFVDVGILSDDNFKVIPHLVLKGQYNKGVSETLIEIKV